MLDGNISSFFQCAYRFPSQEVVEEGVVDLLISQQRFKIKILVLGYSQMYLPKPMTGGGGGGGGGGGPPRKHGNIRSIKKFNQFFLTILPLPITGGGGGGGGGPPKKEFKH